MEENIKDLISQNMDYIVKNSELNDLLDPENVKNINIVLKIVNRKNMF